MGQISRKKAIFLVAILGMYRLACSEDASEKQESISILDRIAQSTPERQITLPLIGGLTESEARDRIRRSGHQGRITTLVTSKTVNCPNQAKSANIGRVCASKPNYLDSNERLVDINADITLLIQGDRDLDEPYGIPPRVLGISRDSAIKTLIQQGFSNLSFRFVEDSGCPSQTVCRLRNAAFGQMPDGTWEGMNAVRRTEELTLYVGTSYPKGNNKLDAAMISIVGYAIDAALEKLDEFGVRGTISPDMHLACSPEGKAVEKGRICGQNPPAGQQTFGLMVRFALGSN